MDAEIWGFIGTLLGTVVGAGVSVGTTTITNRNAARLQSDANTLERAERARAFQRDNLLTTQEALQDLTRLMGRAHYEDLLAHRETGQWGRNMLSDGVSEKLMLANRKFSALVERVADDALREGLKSIHRRVGEVTGASCLREAEERYANLAPYFSKIMEHLGTVLRNTY